MQEAEDLASVTDRPVGAENFAFELVDRIGRGWDAIVAGFSDFCLEQSASYMGSRWSSSRLCGLIMRDISSGEVAAAALAVVVALPLVKAGMAYVKFGPLWRRADRPIRAAVLNGALNGLSDQFGKGRGLHVRVMPPAEPEHEGTWARELSNAGYRLHRTIDHPERYLIDLKLSEAEQLESLGGSWRRNLRKASPEVRVQEVDPQRSLPVFMDLYKAMGERKHFVDYHHPECLTAFLEAAPPELKLRMFLAEAGGRPVAASLLAGSGERVFVPFSATSDEALSLRAGFTLRWAIINRLCDSQSRWLDIGGHEGNRGLRNFKEGNAGTAGRVVTIPGEFDHPSGRLSAGMAALLGWAHDHTRRLRAG
jgi:hypothetical protein